MNKHLAFLVLCVVSATLLACGCAEEGTQAQASVQPEAEAPEADPIPTPTPDQTLDRTMLENTWGNVTFTNSNMVDGVRKQLTTRNMEDAERESYLYPDISNDLCGNVLAANGTVELQRYFDGPMPEYETVVNIWPAGDRSVQFDTIRIDYRNGNDTMITWLGKAETLSGNEESGGTFSSADIVLAPGESFRFFTDTESALNYLLAYSSNGNTSLSVGVYDDAELVGAFHARLPTVYETDGRPAEIAVGETQPIEFRDFVTVGKMVDKDFYENNPYYAPQ